MERIILKSKKSLPAPRNGRTKFEQNRDRIPNPREVMGDRREGENKKKPRSHSLGKKIV